MADSIRDELSTDYEHIFLLYGSYAPFHRGHAATMQLAMDAINAEPKKKLGLFMPVNKHHKKASVQQMKEERVEITKLSLEDCESQYSLIVDDFPMDKDHYIKEMEILEYLSTKYPNAKVYFVFGDDNLICIVNETYTYTHEIVNSWVGKAELVIVTGRDYSTEDLEKMVANTPLKIPITYASRDPNNPIHYVSSTEIRNLISEKAPASKFEHIMFPKGIQRFHQKFVNVAEDTGAHF